MTEYDYSPDAWEHYMAQQARVSKWVSHTTAQAHAYSDPFTMSPSLRDRSFYDEPDGKPQRPVPSRSHTFNLPPARREVHPRHISSRPPHERLRSQSIENRSSSSSAIRSTSNTTRTSSNKKLPSRSYNVEVIYPRPTPPPYQQPHRHVQPYQKRSQPVRQHTSPEYYYPGQSHGSHQRTIYLPPPRPGQSYLIPNGRVEYQYGPPAPKKPQPLFKRLLGFMSPGSGSRSYGPEKLHRGSRRRTSY